jgi:uncharacterized protein (TIGR02266 family)
MNRRMKKHWRLPFLSALIQVAATVRRACASPSRELRKYPRVPISIRVTRRGSGTFGYYHTYNISAGGVFLKSIEPLSPGSVLDLEFALAPGGERIQVRGVVAWVRDPSRAGAEPAGMGIKFTEISEDSQRAVRAFVEMRR